MQKRSVIFPHRDNITCRWNIANAHTCITPLGICHIWLTKPLSKHVMESLEWESLEWECVICSHGLHVQHQHILKCIYKGSSIIVNIFPKCTQSTLFHDPLLPPKRVLKNVDFLAFVELNTLF